MSRGAGPVSHRTSARSTTSARHPSADVAALASLVRGWAEEVNGQPPLTREINGHLWIAMRADVLDAIEDDPMWYEGYALDHPIQVLGSGAIRTTSGNEDQALVRLAERVYPFSWRLREARQLSDAPELAA